VLLDWPASMGSEGFRSARGEGAVRRPPVTDQLNAGQARDAGQAPLMAPDADAPDDRKGRSTRVPGRSGSPLALRNWRVSWRLIALIAIPTVTAIAFGGVRIEEANSAATSDQHVQQLAALGNAIAGQRGLVPSMEDEENVLAQYVAEGRPPSTQDLLLPQANQAVTNLASAQVESLANGIGAGFPPQVQAAVTTVLEQIQNIKDLRTQALRTQSPVENVIKGYSSSVSSLLSLNDQIAASSGDPQLSADVRTLDALSRSEDAAAEERAILTAVLTANQQNTSTGWQTGLSTLLIDANAEQAAEITEFGNEVPDSESTAYSTTVGGAQVNIATQILSEAQIDGPKDIVPANASPGPATFSNAAKTWDEDMTFEVNQMRLFEQTVLNSIQSRAAVLHNQATQTVVDTAIEVLLVMLLVLLVTLVVARSMVRPLRRLRTGALEIAGLRLPETVRRMSESDGEAVSLDVEPIDVFSTDEIGEVARAFDQVHREALRLAANEAALRGNVNAMFVNLSRRSQSLVERQLRLIDELEQGEQDPERLSSLFQMDHLATRMRRNSENLLVLAGHEGPRRWNQPVALVDVLRAALSEIEQYERVTLNVQPGIAVRGQAVSDVVHLTAELIENATTFSAADTPVTIAGHLLSSGGVLLEITDQGVGMGAEEMAHANWRLDNPPVVDVAVSRRMGLFVVARMAARHGIRVRLRPGAVSGLIALVWLPDETIMHETPEAPGGRRGEVEALEPATGPLLELTVGSLGPSNGAITGDWQDAGRAATEREVSAARTPRYAPLRAEADESALGPRRIPGVGPRPGRPVAGSVAAFQTVPRPADDDGFEPPATRPQPAVGANGEPPREPESENGAAEPVAVPFDSFATGPQPVLSAPAVTADGETDQRIGVGSDGASYSWESDSRTGGVVVPPADGIESENRLPIFEAVESDWFRRGRQAVGRPGREAEPATAGSTATAAAPSASTAPAATAEPAVTGNGWTSPADEGWRAAEAVSAPSSGGVTPAGLPKRVPRANLVPGAAGEPADAPTGPAPVRSAAATRERFASFQRGVRKGRAAATGAGDVPGGGDDASS
jgi:signal transduction histidine kinase